MIHNQGLQKDVYSWVTKEQAWSKFDICLKLSIRHASHGGLALGRQNSNAV